MLRIAVPLILLVAACATVPKPAEGPTVDAKGLAITSVSARAVEGELAFDVFNPNTYGVPLEHLAWRLELEGAAAVTGHVNIGKTIAARDSEPLVEMVTLEDSDAIALADRIAEGRTAYTVRGTMRFATQKGPVEVDFAYRGDFRDARQAYLTR